MQKHFQVGAISLLVIQQPFHIVAKGLVSSSNEPLDFDRLLNQSSSLSFQSQPSSSSRKHSPHGLDSKRSMMTGLGVSFNSPRDCFGDILAELVSFECLPDDSVSVVLHSHRWNQLVEGMLPRDILVTTQAIHLFADRSLQRGLHVLPIGLTRQGGILRTLRCLPLPNDSSRSELPLDLTRTVIFKDKVWSPFRPRVVRQLSSCPHVPII